MKISSQKLLNDLSETTKVLISKAKKFQELEDSKLNWKKNPESWSILECLEHLNLYGDFYLPEIERCIQKSDTNSSLEFKSGYFGNRFAEDMKPKEKLNTMKTFKDKNPSGSQLSKEVINRFIRQQEKMLDLLKQAEKVNLNKIKTKITLPILKFRLGDTFRFTIYHNERHLAQAEKVNA